MWDFEPSKPAALCVRCRMVTFQDDKICLRCKGE